MVATGAAEVCYVITVNVSQQVHLCYEFISFQLSIRYKKNTFNMQMMHIHAHTGVHEMVCHAYIEIASNLVQNSRLNSRQYFTHAITRWLVNSKQACFIVIPIYI